MQHASVTAAALFGVRAHLVHVEADITPGLPVTHIVGLPDTSVREARDRVQAALRNSGFDLPPARITLNLAPAELPKEGTGFDLPIALAMLAACGKADPASLAGLVLFGELALAGPLRPVRGVLGASLAARRSNARGIIVPAENRAEAASVEGLEVAGARDLREVVERAADPGFFERGRSPESRDTRADGPDLAEVKGHTRARRALEIAAAGGHNILLVGPPGTGKTMLARRLPTLLPPLAPEEAIEATTIHSVAGSLTPGAGLLSRPPFRAPHHTVSEAGLVGGRNPPRPGEVSLAHRGVLFLDELPEFRRSALEALRQPVEDGRILVVRAGRAAEFPARFQLVASMNPCPCGYAGPTGKACRCSSPEIRRYRSRLSGPLLDRIDLHVRVETVDVERLTGTETGETSAAVRERVVRAREVQAGRGAAFPEAPGRNAELAGSALTRLCALPPGGRALLATALRRRGLSARALTRVLRVGRTIADLAGRDEVALSDLAEAIRYRLVDGEARDESQPVSRRTASR